VWVAAIDNQSNSRLQFYSIYWRVELQFSEKLKFFFFGNFVFFKRIWELQRVAPTQRQLPSIVFFLLVAQWTNQKNAMKEWRKAREPKKQHLFKNSNVNVLSTTSNRREKKNLYFACAISKTASTKTWPQKLLFRGCFAGC
jgi:hypothetical protein